MGLLRSSNWRWWTLAVLAVVSMIILGDMALAQEAAPPADAAAPPKAGGGMLEFLVHFFKSLGIIFGAILGIISICLIAFVVMLFLDLRMRVIIPPGFVEEFTDTVNKRQFKQAFDMARGDNSFLGRTLTAGMSRLQYGLEDARDAAGNMVDSIKSGKEQMNTYLAVIGTLGPLLGLVGTVFGMIKSFMAMGTGGQINAALLADGISHALCVTLAGVGLAVPAIFFNSFFKNRITHVSMEASNISDDLLTQMYHNSKKPAPPSGTTPGASVATAAPTSQAVTPVKPA
jgi:biopolymer transport protein ExbB